MFMLIVSFFGLLLVALLQFSPPIPQESLTWRKPIVGSMFALVCVLGILAVFSPNTCSRVFERKKEQRWSGFIGFKRGDVASKCGSYALRGHHPSCEGFSSHVFRVGDKIFCATCSGLFMGAVIVLVGVAYYFLLGNSQVGYMASSAVWAGILGVVLGLLQPLVVTLQRSVIRVFSGAFLAVGTFLILVGIDELAQSTFLDVFLVFLTVFWLLTRISLSQWEHKKICSTCSVVSCDSASQTKKVGV
jgi:hypothetical protein